MFGGRYDGIYYEDGEKADVKCFNTTGTCISEINYMADTSAKIRQIIDQYICSGKYFTINLAWHMKRVKLSFWWDRDEQSVRSHFKL